MGQVFLPLNLEHDRNVYHLVETISNLSTGLNLSITI